MLPADVPERPPDPSLPRDRAFTPGAPIPFEHVWAPLLGVVRRRLRGAVDAAAHRRFTGVAHAGLERVLLGRVADVATRTLYREYLARRAGDRDATYAAFVRTESAAGLCDVAAAYPVLAGLLTTLADDWVDATARLVQRFAADHDLLVSALCGGRPLGRITRVEARNSEPHTGGQPVVVLHPARGRAIVYLPQTLALEAAYAGLLRWLDTALPIGTPQPQALRVLDRGTHGWAEHVASSPAADRAARARYGERAGVIVCLVHLLRGRDMHAGSVVADGEHPMLNDLGTLCGPILRDGAPDNRQYEHGVLDTGLIPRVCIAASGAGWIDSGLTSPHDRSHHEPLPCAGEASAASTGGRWVDVNTDAMRWDPHPPLAPFPGRVPRAQGARCSADDAATADLAAAVMRGFRRTYHILRARRPEILAVDGPLAAFAAGSSRVQLRAPSVYHVLLARATQPPLLRDAAARAAEFDVLRRSHVWGSEPPGRRAVLDTELAALQRHDVPQFTIVASTTDLHAHGRGLVCAGYAVRSGYEAVRCDVRAMSRRKLRRQLHHIRIALAADHHRDASSATPYASLVDDAGMFSAAATLAEVARLASLLRAVAVPHRGRAVWYAHDIGGGQQHLAQVGHSLESGQVGIALFFAAHARVLETTGHGAAACEAAAWARAALGPVYDAVRQSARGPASRPTASRPGFGVGWGGIAYALACVASLVDDADAADAARAAVQQLGVPGPRAPSDVFAGAAGAVLGALAVHCTTGDAADLASASAWGDLLLAQSAWRRDGDGFGHGAGGVAAALLCLTARTGDPRYAPPDVRALLRAPRDSAGVPNVSGGWCRGPSGAGLARATALATGLGTPDERADWRSELATAARRYTADDARPWSLCCGALARVDLLLEAAEALGQPARVDDARALAAHVFTGARRRRSYATPAHAEALVPGLLRGVAGIGYTLLRVTDPELLPSVLTARLPCPPRRTIAG